MEQRIEHPLGGTPGRITTGWESVRRSRWSAVAPRYLATAVLFLFAALGLRSAIFPPSPPAPAVVSDRSADAPIEDFALQFARAYLTYDANRPDLHALGLSPFVPEDLDGGAGFAPAAGRQTVLWADVASNQPALAGGRVVTVAARISTQSQPVYLAVTVQDRRDGPLSLVGYPSFVGAPSVDTASSLVPRDPVENFAVTQVVDRVVRNYLSGQAPNLTADLTQDAIVTLPTLQLSVESVDQLVWTAGPSSQAVLATVSAIDSKGNVYTLTYELGIAYRERPYVDFIQVIPTDT